ncbi:MAG TPA: Stk1 family PASTA domain-containing Ser/Thr kinase [Acidimicrobiaceae bacterium]|nr:Stk1 family PASTA domain-containing Ser/Thr kinase [Acidimicrobiaceae bacterium]
MTSPESPNPPEPVVLGGRYEIHRRLARGGMAEVFLARDSALDRPVAVKVLFPEFATDPSFVERFRREAQSAANLTHPNIVGVYDWGAESGTYYIVMEYVDGQSLAEILRATGPLHPRRAAEIAFDVAGALGVAHQRGVVHRDVKPGNVLISSSGIPKVADFGIARALSSVSEELTQTGSVMGTATYFSPEQAQGFAVDARSDLYSLGVVLFEILCGRPPFVGDSPVAIAYKHVQERVQPPSELISGMPPGLEAVILRLLAKNPDDRYRSAEDLRADLRRWLDGGVTLAEQALSAHITAPTQAIPVVDPDATRINPTVSEDPNATRITPRVAPVQQGPAAAAAAPMNPVPSSPAPVALGSEAAPSSSKNGLFYTAILVLLALLAGLGFWFIKSLNDERDAVVERVDVPFVTGLEEAEAVTAIREAGLNPQVKSEPSDSAVKGVVFRQSPEAGSKLRKNSNVLITVSSGPAMTTVPKVTGATEADAKKLLETAGFSVVVEKVDSELPEGTVVETVPAADQPIPTAGEIRLKVSGGPGTAPIPVVAGKTVADAEKALVAAGFTVGEVVPQASPTVKKDQVIGTDPTGTASPKSVVKILVSTGPEQVKVPAVKGQAEDAAKAALKERALEAEVVPQSVPAGDPNAGRVIDSNPAAGTLVDPGTVVKLTVGVASTSPTSTVAPSTTVPSVSTTSSP